MKSRFQPQLATVEEARNAIIVAARTLGILGFAVSMAALIFGRLAG